MDKCNDVYNDNDNNNRMKETVGADINNTMRLLLANMIKMTKEQHHNIKLIHGTTGDQCSIAEMLVSSLRLATYWRHTGTVKHGDIVTLMLDNNVHYYTPVLASWLCGAGLSLSDPDTNMTTLTSQLNIANSSTVVISPRLGHKIQALKESCPWLKIFSMGACNESAQDVTTIFNDPEMDLKRKLINDDDMETNLDDIAAIFWSSGTTGLPKGITYKHRHFLQSTLLAEKKSELGLTLTSSCMFHASTFPKILNCLIVNATNVIILDSNCSTEEILQAVDDWAPFRALIKSFHFAKIASSAAKCPVGNWNLRSLHEIVTLGSRIPAKYEAMMRHNVPSVKTIGNLYGMTEVGLISQSETLANIGQPLPDIQTKIIDTETGDLVTEGNQGELCVKSGQSFDGYLGSEEKILDDAGWLHTGDVVYRDNDGNLIFVDRIKSLIKCDAKHVQPSEIENMILQANDKIREASVFGVPDPFHQEVVGAAIVLMDDIAEIDVEKLRRTVNQGLEHHKQLKHRIIILPHLPRNSIGKVLKRELGMQI